MSFDKPQIELVLAHTVDDFLSVAHRQSYTAARMTLHEITDQQRAQIIANGQGGADIKRANALLATQQLFNLFGAIK